MAPTETAPITSTCTAKAPAIPRLTPRRWTLRQVRRGNRCQLKKSPFHPRKLRWMRTKQRPPSSKTLHPPTGRRKPPLSRTNAVLLSSLFSIQFHYLSFPHVTFNDLIERRL